MSISTLLMALAIGEAPSGKAIASYLHSATLFDFGTLD
jgi:hypothetical protein